jgi:hypothetical protein
MAIFGKLRGMGHITVCSVRMDDKRRPDGTGANQAGLCAGAPGPSITFGAWCSAAGQERWLGAVVIDRDH